MPDAEPIAFPKNLVQILIAAGALPVTAACAAPVQPWPNALLIAPLAPGWQASAEAVERVADEARPSQLETRLQVGHALSKCVMVWAGWVRFENYLRHAANTHENQAVEQINWNMGTIGPVRLATRTRLEQRLVSGVDQTSWRWRQQLRAALPLHGSHGPSAILWAEPFLSHNRTGAQSHTLDQLRTFAGVTFPVTRRIDLEIGYLNQRIYRPATTIVNDAIPMILTVRL